MQRGTTAAERWAGGCLVSVGVALAKAVVVQLAHERREVAVLEGARKNLALHLRHKTGRQARPRAAKYGDGAAWAS